MGVGSSSSVGRGRSWVGRGGSSVLQMVVGCRHGTPSVPHHLVVVSCGWPPLSLPFFVAVVAVVVVVVVIVVVIIVIVER